MEWKNLCRSTTGLAASYEMFSKNTKTDVCVNSQAYFLAYFQMLSFDEFRKRPLSGKIVSLPTLIHIAYIFFSMGLFPMVWAQEQ